MTTETRYITLLVLGIVTLVITWQLYSSMESANKSLTTLHEQALVSLLANLSDNEFLMDSDLKNLGVADAIRKSHPLNVPSVKREQDQHIEQPPRLDEGRDIQKDEDKLSTSVERSNKFNESITNSSQKVYEDKLGSSQALEDGQPVKMSSEHGTVSEMNVPHSDALPQFNMSAMVQVREKPYRAYWVDVDAPLIHRLRMYNYAIEELRADTKHKRGFREWSDPPPNPVVLWGSYDDFLQRVSNFTDIKTIALTWLRTGKGSSEDCNLLIQTYYTWTASEPLCEWIRTRAYTKARYDAVYNRSCTSDIREGDTVQPLKTVYLHGKPINPNHYWPNNGDAYPEHFYTTPPPHVLYLQVAEDAVVTDVGDVYSGTVKLVPYSCSHDLNPIPPAGYTQTPIYTEVFIMTGYWGTSHFHKSIELLPRVAPYLDLLTRHPDIMIQVSETSGRTGQVLKMLGIHEDRLISGTVRTKIAYLPQSTPCGFAQVQGIQVLSMLYRDRLKHLAQNTSATERRGLIMIHRSGLRHLTNALHIALLIRRLAKDYGLTFYLYHDQQLPSFDETMVIFNHAAMVVAPHGAGESNLLFCEPGTFVIEAMCNPPHVNLCYQRVAHVLGLRYHGIPSEEGCEDHINVNPKVIEFVVRAKLQMWKELSIIK